MDGDTKTMYVSLALGLLAMLIYLHGAYSLPETTAINVSNQVEKLAAENNVTVERENGFEYKFSDGRGIGGAGGQGGVLVPRESEQSLVNKAREANSSIHFTFTKNGLSTAEKFYWVPADNSFYCWIDRYQIPGSYQIIGASQSQIFGERVMFFKWVGGIIIGIVVWFISYVILMILRAMSRKSEY